MYTMSGPRQNGGPISIRTFVQFLHSYNVVQPISIHFFRLRRDGVDGQNFLRKSYDALKFYDALRGSMTYVHNRYLSLSFPLRGYGLDGQNFLRNFYYKHPYAKL